MVSVACDGGLSRCDGEHDAQAEGDDHPDGDPCRAYSGEGAGVPESQHGADDEDEVADEEKVDESHWWLVTDGSWPVAGRWSFPATSHSLNPTAAVARRERHDG